jgi:hypothetical protein
MGKWADAPFGGFGLFECLAADEHLRSSALLLTIKRNWPGSCQAGFSSAKTDFWLFLDSTNCWKLRLHG